MADAGAEHIIRDDSPRAVISRGGQRGLVATLWGLYGSPRRFTDMVRKAVGAYRARGLAGIRDAVRGKLRRPVLPVSMSTAAAAGESEARLHLSAIQGKRLDRSVSIIVLTRGRQGLLDRCLESVARSVAAEAGVDILVVTNGGPVSAVQDFPFPVRVVPERRAFNWAYYNNQAVKQTDGEYVLFLNDDVEALVPGWLDAMLGVAEERDVGVVGAKLLFPEGTVQHVGIRVNRACRIDHPYKYVKRDVPIDWDNLDINAVTGACMLTARSLFTSLSGFDEDLAFNLNDVDYCLRAIEVGKKVSMCPQAEFLHWETATRPFSVSSREQEHFERRWLARDGLLAPLDTPGEGPGAS